MTINATILKISTSKAGKTWLTISVQDEFTYTGMVQSTKPADAYSLKQEIRVPENAIRPMPASAEA